MTASSRSSFIFKGQRQKKLFWASIDDLSLKRHGKRDHKVMQWIADDRVIGHIHVLPALGNDTNGGHVKKREPGHGLAAAAYYKSRPFGLCYTFLQGIFLGDPGIVNKWVENPEHLTGCVSCNKCQQKIKGMIVCRRDE
jgi:hypothetical protein